MDATRPVTRKLHPNVGAELYAELAAFAARTHRSLNGAVTYFIEKGLRDEQPVPGAVPVPRSGQQHF